MKFTYAALSLALTIFQVEARGRGGNGSSKGKSVVEEVEDPCECPGPITTAIATSTAEGDPLLTLQDAIAAAPPGCVLTTPTDEDLLVYSPAGLGPIIVPIVANTAAVATCTTEPADIPMGGCAEGWTFLDGTPVDSTVGVAPAQWVSATQFEPIATVQGTNPIQFGTIAGNTPLTAYYSCCLVDEATCTAFTEPATMVPTPAPTKGKSGRNGNGGRRLY